MVPGRWFLKFLGFINSLEDVNPLGRLHVRPLQSGGYISTLQCSRDESRFARSFSFPSSVEVLGELFCLYQQPGRYKVSYSVFSVSGASSVLSEEQHSLFSEACSLQAQRVGRHSLPVSQACVARVVSLPSSVQFNLSGLGSSPRRSVATSLNNRLPTIVYPVPEEKALAVDAFSISWEGMNAYAFPPFILVGKVIQKFRSHSCLLTLIALAFSAVVSRSV